MNFRRRRQFLALLGLVLASLGRSHPGNAIVAGPDGGIFAGDAVGSAVWRFGAGSAPEQIIRDFHCHWVTLGRDGGIYGDVVEVDGEKWTTSFHRIDPRGKRTTEVWRGTADSSAFLVDEDSSVVMFQNGGVVAVKAGRPPVPFRSDGKPASGQGALTGVKAMAWGPRGEVFLLSRNQLWVAAADGALKVRTVFQGRASGLYAGPDDQIQPWGLAADATGRVLVADPSRGLVVRVDQRGEAEVIARTVDDWAIVGVAVQGERLLLLEAKTVGNRNYGPRVSVLEPNGRRWVMGTVAGP